MICNLFFNIILLISEGVNYSGFNGFWIMLIFTILYLVLASFMTIPLFLCGRIIDCGMNGK